MNKDIYDLEHLDNNAAYKLLKELLQKPEVVYDDFSELIPLLQSDNSMVRVRAFQLICSLARVDKQNKINAELDIILHLLDDTRVTSIRPCLQAIPQLLTYKTELKEEILKKIESIDVLEYKESCQHLIYNDINQIIKNFRI